MMYQNTESKKTHPIKKTLFGFWTSELGTIQFLIISHES